MEVYRKIKIFKFSDYPTWEFCEALANEYYAEIAYKGIECDLILNSDYIAVILPKDRDLFKYKERATVDQLRELREEQNKLTFRVKGKDLIGVSNENINPK